MSGRGREPSPEPATDRNIHTTNVGCPLLLAARGQGSVVESPKPCSMESSCTLLRVVKGAESLVAGHALMGLQPTGHGSPGQRLCRRQGITGSLLTALNFFAISTCSYLRPMPGVLWPVIASEIRSGTSRSSSTDFR